MNPTELTYQTLSTWFEQLNDYFYDGDLPHCLLTLQRKRNAAGYFMPLCFMRRMDRLDDELHEIAINPEVCTGRTDEEIASTLLHEMVHLWQEEHGKPAKGSYHNKEWAEEMKRVGLQPVSLDRPGAETGRRCTHEIVKDGPFAQFFASTLSASQLPFAAAAMPRATSDAARNKTRYSCKCGNNVWGKPGLRVACLECGLDYEEQ